MQTRGANVNPAPQAKATGYHHGARRMTPELALALSLSRQAGTILLKYYRAEAELAIKQKPDSSPVSKEELASHEFLVPHFEKETGIFVLSEEGESLDNLSDRNEFWCIDPLDGTREFLAHTDEFVINIALIKAG